jgi:hypothetical protein
MYTTLNKIRAHGPCSFGWLKLLRYLGKAKPDDEPLSLATILKSNGLGDAIWCLRAVDGHSREMRLFAVKCVRSLQHEISDRRSLNALDVAEAYANGQATVEQLRTAHDDARLAVLELQLDGCSRDEYTVMGAAVSAVTEDAAEAASWASARMLWDNGDFQEKLFIDTFINREGEVNVQDS